jgi:hypothetical protein
MAPTFNAMVQSFDSWEFDLLQHVQFKHDVFTTVAKMEDGFLAASDGSVSKTNYGAYGWIVALKNGERIIQAAGPARGGRMNSYRAEGYGILSFLRFLVRLKEYCSTNKQWEWQLTCDNLSFVERINGQAEARDSETHHQMEEIHDWTHWADIMSTEVDERDEAQLTASATTNNHATLDPDWDILNEIRWNLRNSELGGGGVEHIKGHQDRIQRYQELSLKAQLNVDADRIAGDFRETMDKPETQVYLFPMRERNSI